jgi:hypothetical protein
LGNGDITLANTSGDLVVNQAVNAGTGTVRLSSPAGGVSQTVAGVITAGGLGVIAANAVTLTSAANAVGTLAGSVTNTGQAFSFNNTSRDLVVGTIPAAGFFTGATGVATTNGDLVLKTTTSGNIALNQNVSAGTANAALTAAGNLSETSGAITTANELIANAGGSVALDNGNLVNSLSGRAGTTFAFTNAQALILAQVPAVLGVGPQSDVITTAGDIRIRTTTGGLTLSATGNVCAGVSAQNCANAANNNAALVAAGNALETGGGFVKAVDLIVNASGSVTFDAGPNQVTRLSGRAGTTFAFTNATALDIGGVPLVIDVGPQSDVRTVAGDIRIKTNTGNLSLIDDGAGTGNVCAGSDCTTAALNNAALVAL